MFKALAIPPLKNASSRGAFSLPLSAFLHTLVFSLALLAGCATATTLQDPPFLPEEIKPGPRSTLIYAYLKMDQAMRRDDMEGVLSAANLLVKDGPASRPLADAAAWLLGNRYVDEARELLEKSVAALPEDLPLHIMLAETMLETGETQEAINLLQAFIQRHPEEFSAQIELALVYLNAEQPKEAQAIFASLPEGERTPTILYYEAQALRALGDLPGTAARLRAALAAAPDFLEVMLELALVEEQQDNFEASRELFEQLLTYDEGNQDILLRLLILALKEGNPEKAFQIASRVQDSFGFALTAASLFMNEGRYDLAEALLAELSTKPETPGEIAFYQAAVAYEGSQDVARTLDLLDTIESSSRYYDRAIKLRIQVLYENGRLDEALTEIREAKELFPDDREIQLAEVEILLSLRHNAEAIALMETLATKYPEDSNLAFRHAFMVDLNGDRARALQLMEALLVRFPDEAQILNYIGYTLAEENRDLKRALDLINQAIELSPDSDYIVDSLAWVHYQLGNYQDAWDAIQQAIELARPGKPDPTMWEHYGDIAHAIGLIKEARQGWETALELDPDDPSAIRAKLEKL